MFAPIILLPLVAAIVAIAIFRKPQAAKYLAITGSLIGLGLTLAVSYGSANIAWFSVGSHTISLSIAVTPLNYLLLFVVMLMGPIVMIYSAGYMGTLSEHRRYYIEMLSFQAAMATFAISGSFITLFIAWEFLSLTSYLLIGFWHSRERANRAARKALTIIFIGDLALLASIVIFWNIFGTLSFVQIIASVSSHVSADLTAGMLLLLLAIFTKSAQFPFHEWLIDAMEGPTPVSAYLHSSTMVKAGVFAAILLYPLFSSTGVSGIMLVFGIVTAIISTLAASREYHVKKVIAYSTIQELSIMLVAVASGAIMAAIYFFFAQSFYKALLFFTSGVEMESTDKEYLNEISGLRENRLVYLSTIFGVVSLAGFIPFSGFFANEGISISLLPNLAVYAVISGISLLTSFYIFRWVSYGAKRSKNAYVSGNYRGQPKSMVYPMVLLAALTLVSSAFVIYMGGFLNYGGYLAYLYIPGSLPSGIADGIVFLILISIGAVLGYEVYYKNRIKMSASRLDPIIYTNPIISWGYLAVAAIAYAAAEGISAFDTYLGYLLDRIGRVTVQSGYLVRRASVGDINSYAAMFIIGVLALFALFYYLVILQ